MNYSKAESANPKPIERAHDPALRGATAALRRAAKRARLEAERTGTCLIIARGKGWVRFSPKPQSGSKKP
jgi:hypothetical protein